MRVYIHYNLHGGDPDAHVEVKRQMIDELHYFNHFLDGGVRKYLPNTSLCHSNKLFPQTAIDDFKNIVNTINRSRTPTNKLIIEKCVAMPFINVSAI